MVTRTGTHSRLTRPKTLYGGQVHVFACNCRRLQIDSLSTPSSVRFRKVKVDGREARLPDSLTCCLHIGYFERRMMAALGYARIWHIARDCGVPNRMWNERPDRLRQINLPRLTNLFRRLPHES
jgi:hypothetical protein